MPGRMQCALVVQAVSQPSMLDNRYSPSIGSKHFVSHGSDCGAADQVISPAVRKFTRVSSTDVLHNVTHLYSSLSLVACASDGDRIGLKPTVRGHAAVLLASAGTLGGPQLHEPVADERLQQLETRRHIAPDTIDSTIY